MTKKRFLLMTLMMAMLSSFSVRVLADPVDLNLGYLILNGNSVEIQGETTVKFGASLEINN